MLFDYDSSVISGAIEPLVSESLRYLQSVGFKQETAV
ncbi:protein of unknown function [Serratia sp. Tan611]|nr:protein of unknown function [Serratia sp. Tan611]